MKRDSALVLRVASWSFVDQALSSFTNFSAVIVAAHLLSAVAFGTFTLAIAGYGFTVGINFAVSGEPYQIRFSNRKMQSAHNDSTQAALGMAALVGICGLLIACVLSLLLPLTFQGPALAIGISLPGLLVQDSVRQVYFAHDKPSFACLMDGIWLLSSFAVGTSLYVLNDLRSPAILIIAWSCGAWISGAAGCIHLQNYPDLIQTKRWLSENRKISPSFLLDFVAMSGAALIVIYLLPFFVGVASVGNLNATQVFFGPLRVIMVGTRVFGVPEGVRRRAEGSSFFRRDAMRYMAVISSIAFIYCLAIIGFAPIFGSKLLGAQWELAKPLLPFVALSTVGAAITLGPFLGLRVLANGKRILRARSLDAPMTIVSGLAGAIFFGIKGAALGMGLSNLVVASMWLRQFLLACNDADL